VVAAGEAVVSAVHRHGLLGRIGGTAGVGEDAHRDPVYGDPVASDEGLECGDVPLAGPHHEGGIIQDDAGRPAKTTGTCDIPSPRRRHAGLQSCAADPRVAGGRWLANLT
jgi:hypothetical protein